MMFQGRPSLSIAPMIDISNTHFRNFIRILTSEATLYTEMLHHNAILHHHAGLLPFHVNQHPLVLQLGGSHPQKLAEAAEIAVHRYSYDQINLNVGCPSPRVQSGSFGACLMKQPQLVYDCMKAIRERVKGTACTVKCRLGVDEYDSYQFAKDFVNIVSKEGNVDHFIVHARKAFLQGLNPAQNRNIPPLWYDRVYQLQKDFPHINFTLNGGVKTVKDAKTILDEHKVWGIMIGRTAYENPYQLIKADQIIFDKIQKPILSRSQVLMKYADYLDRVQNGDYINGVGPNENQASSIKHHHVNPSVLIKPIINMFYGQKNNSVYRQYLSDAKRLKNSILSDVIKDVLKIMEQSDKGKKEKQLIEEEQ